MKSLHVVTLIAFLTVVVQAQSQPESKPRSMADATYALKGPVKTFRTEIATFVLKDGQYVEGPRVVREEAWFNPDGNRTNLHMYQNGNLAGRIVMKFEGRKMVEVINYNGSGGIYLRSLTSYNEAGEAQERKTYIHDGSLGMIARWKRNARGKVIEFTEHDDKGVLLQVINNKYEGLDLYISERKTYFHNGSLKSEEVYSAPNKRTEVHYKLDGSVDHKSVRVGEEMVHYNADGSLRRATVIDQGDRLLDEMNFQKDGSKTRATQLPDEVDQHGNWTKQTRWSADPKGARPLQVTYRALTYYEN